MGKCVRGTHRSVKAIVVSGRYSVVNLQAKFGGIRMALRSLVVSLVVCLIAPFAFAQGPLPDLVIPMDQQDYISIEPQPEYQGAAGNILHTFRSYRVVVRVINVGAPTNACFVVRTNCVRGNQIFKLGEGRTGLMSGLGYAAYDIFPSSAGNGPCVLQTIVDADNQVQESNEGATSAVLNQSHSTKATVTK